MILPDHKPLLRELINQLEDSPLAIEFGDPFPWRKMGLVDYFTIVKKPMDFRTLRKKLGVRGKHKKYKNFFKDLQRIWDNCKIYQPKGSRMYRHAEIMEKVSRKLVAQFRKQVGMKGATEDKR